MNEKQNARDYFEQSSTADWYAERAFPVPPAGDTNPRGTIFHALREHLVFDLVRAGAEGKVRVLEVGCGAGSLFVRLVQHGLDARAIDPSSAMVERTRDLLTTNGLEPSLVAQSDLASFETEERFDVVVSCGVIMYVESQRDFLRKVARLLSPRGRCVITHRNALFDLSALNEGTPSFLGQYLLEHYEPEQRAELLAKLAAEVPGLGVAREKQNNTHLFRSAEVPFEMAALYREAGLTLREIAYCSMHPAPPRLDASADPELLAAIQRKYQSSWIGAFLGSQFAVVADLAP